MINYRNILKLNTITKSSLIGLTSSISSVSSISKLPSSYSYQSKNVINNKNSNTTYLNSNNKISNHHHHHHHHRSYSFIGHGNKDPNQKISLPNIKYIIAVSSAKGGVGKSTLSVNLALALNAMPGISVGILDADVFGPSLPIMMNLRNQQPAIEETTKRMIPLQNYGIKCMSMGFLVEEDDAMIWRGPMVMGALEKLLGSTAWGNLDVLVVDLPPGTGDAILTMCQRVPLSGAVIISTPQDVALADVIRGVKMFNKVNIPILGVVENMSHFECPNCNHSSNIFGKEGAVKTARDLGLELLGEVPINIDIRECADKGTPITISQPESKQATIYKSIAKKMLEQLLKLKQQQQQK
ncbi:Mrp/NBP35 family protein [Cavenderia fasciculata]|uniref:Mrp/NBP35 family protein n=1 Tax=Cavenderia fasciculata TaxID=261658 RepID=F4Q4R8_CACFS|nr:Mrp/NBP35 family protein [Cavenderia fasciculata]EGG17864.1 Mrp/NBP35 family protein [Cavenderia fasciculata]|eukprot:XP_004356348.1 Mrp/NBP35 family protein [Cavenderia fasciculata]